MLIVCPSCASEYTIDPANLGADGRTVRCADCRGTWFAAAEWNADAAAPAAEPPAPPAATVSVEKSRPRKRLSLLASILLLCLCLGVGLAGLGRLARAFPADGRPIFRAVTSSFVEEAGGVLEVEGEIANPTERELPLSRLAIFVRNAEEQAIASWTDAPPKPTLGSGEAVRFKTRLNAPPHEGRQVRVQFTTAGGIELKAPSPARE